MFSCFCDTFCCCLRRCRPSSGPATPTYSASNSRSRSRADGDRGLGGGSARQMAEEPSGADGSEVQYAQPPPRLPMPQLGGILDDLSRRASSSHPSDAHTEDPPPNLGQLSPRPKGSPLSSLLSKTHIRRKSHEPPPPTSNPAQSTAASATPRTAHTATSGTSTPHAPYAPPSRQPTEPLPVDPAALDAGRARSPGAVLSRLDDLPSASDFLAASAMPDFTADADEEVELDVPAPGQIPELPAGQSPVAASTAAWREEATAAGAEGGERERSASRTAKKK